MMRIPLKVTYSDGREQAVLVSAPDLIAFERHYDKPSRAIGDGRLEYLWWTAWHAARRVDTSTADSFESWLNSVDNVVDDDDARSEIAPLASSQPTG